MQGNEHGKRTRFGGKYRNVLLAVGFFLLLDSTALLMNFYVSYQITDDAMLINVAGRQRMLSQQITKSLFGLEVDVLAGRPVDAGVAELQRATELFDSTLTAFQRGAAVTVADGQLIHVGALEDAGAREIVEEAVLVWKPYRQAVEAVIASGAGAVQLEAAANYGRVNNVELLTLMNQLTTDLEGSAASRATTLRTIQLVVIMLAFVNFVFIVLNFIRSLRASDAMAESAREETERIFNTVNEGLFLLDRDGTIGSQMSAVLPRIMGRPIEGGMKFLPLLETMVADDVLASARDYIELLFGKRVKEALVMDLNPLQNIEVREAAGGKARYLTLQFNRVKSGDEVLNLLVTVADVTEQVRLAHELELSKRSAREEIATLLATLGADRASLEHFVADAERTLNDVNELLQQPAYTDVDLKRRVAGVFRSIHGLKGDAAALGLGLFENLAHEFENTLCALRDKAKLTGEDLLALPPHLDEMLDRTATVRDLLDALGPSREPARGARPAGVAAELRHRLESLAMRIATEQHKQVHMRVELDIIEDLPEARGRQIYEIALQLLRNAVVHGIEPAAERSRVNKPEAGEIYVALRRDDSGDFELLLRDDGCGIDIEKIRDSLRSNGEHADAELARMDVHQLCAKLFQPGFSTAATVDEHSGRGVGLDLVAESVRALGGRLKLTSRPNRFTQFVVRFTSLPGLEAA